MSWFRSSHARQSAALTRDDGKKEVILYRYDRHRDGDLPFIISIKVAGAAQDTDLYVQWWARSGDHATDTFGAWVIGTPALRFTTNLKGFRPQYGYNLRSGLIEDWSAHGPQPLH